MKKKPETTDAEILEMIRNINAMKTELMEFIIKFKDQVTEMQVYVFLFHTAARLMMLNCLKPEDGEALITKSLDVVRSQAKIDREAMEDEETDKVLKKKARSFESKVKRKNKCTKS
jgi:hypothetical protein